MPFQSRIAVFLAPLAVLATAGLVAACGSSGDNSATGASSDAGSDAKPAQNAGTDGGSFGDGGFGGGGTVTSITIDPPTATIDSMNSLPATQGFTVIGHLSTGGTETLAATWSASNLQVGAIDGTGKYTANGSAGGVVTVTAASNGSQATAQLTVRLHLSENPGNVGPAAQGQLTGAVTPDPTVVWAYPYNGTVFPRGLGAPTLMWMNGAATDAYFVHLTSPTFEYKSFVTSPLPSQVNIDSMVWQKFVDSTAGNATFTMSRFDGTKATVVAKHTWTIAPASMRGTIYYWANNLGRVMRIKPGALMPDDFANQAPLVGPNVYPQSSCLMTCHTVSADGSTIVSGGGAFGGSFDLITGQPKHSLGGVWGGSTSAGSPAESDGQVIQWMDSALSPDGKYMLTNSMALALNTASSPPTTGGFNGMYDTTSGAKVASGVLDTLFTAMPAFAPNGSLVAYVDSGDPGTWTGGWNNPPPGGLRLVDFLETGTPMSSNPRDLVPAGADVTKRIGWPTVSPDAKLVIYQRGASADTRGGDADLYASTALAANQEVRLSALDGDTYPFAAGMRDLSLNYEPTMAPVAAGGYFWVVFTSRRTYGNILTDQAFPDTTHGGTKQLWVAAIDLNPAPGKDPSHPAFRLPGQAVDSVNMRGFWALDPCKGDGLGCASGTECCGGYCDASGDSGAAVCKSAQTTCSMNGDRCTQTSDCCDAAMGVTCINRVCSEPAPK